MEPLTLVDSSPVSDSLQADRATSTVSAAKKPLTPRRRRECAPLPLAATLHFESVPLLMTAPFLVVSAPLLYQHGSRPQLGAIPHRGPALMHKGLDNRG